MTGFLRNMADGEQIIVTVNPAMVSGYIVTLRAKYDHLAAAARDFFLPHAELQVGSGGGSVYRPFEVPLKLPAGTDIKCSATSLANNAQVSVGLGGWIG